ncbi:MAG: hypothetical protein CR991_02070 [Proteobacteria bacterium]|nr:MAG: hypothetical protein CR991_02070 [Pseudomonadota bacterium]
MDVERYLNDAKAKLGFESDYAFAKKLGVTQASITRYRKGDSTFDEYMCFQIADILGLDPSDLITEVKATTEKNPQKQAFWKDRLIEKAGKAIRGGLTKLRLIWIMLNLRYIH